MSTLSDSLSVARNSLRDIQKRMNAISHNISGEKNEDYTKRTLRAHLYSDGSSYTEICRDYDYSLLTDYLKKRSDVEGASVYDQMVEKLDNIYSAKEFGSSPSALIVNLKKSLQIYVNATDTSASPAAVVSDAESLANALNYGSQAIDKLRQSADEEIQGEVNTIKKDLSDLASVEKDLVNGDLDEESRLSCMDKRDAILKDLSSHISITYNIRGDGSVAVYAANGVTLFNRVPAEITYSPATSGKETLGVIKVDGVSLNHTTFADPHGGGRLGHLLKFRDETCLKYKRQLDYIAYRIYNIFDSKKFVDQNGKEIKFFQDIGGAKPANPSGMAERLRVNDLFKAYKGGYANMLGSKKQAQKIIDEFLEKKDPDKDPLEGEFVRQTDLSKTKMSLIDIANLSLSWMGSATQNAHSDLEFKKTSFVHSQQSLSDFVNTNRDEDTYSMVEIEKSYQASAKLLGVIGKMLDELLTAV